jgi:hypothetical protein
MLGVESRETRAGEEGGGRGDTNGFCVACAYVSIIYTHRGIRHP